MTYEPLHHKYRPQTFAELVGQEAIAATLTNAIQQRKIMPAYLFTGARGTGKTSSARILAKSLNCLNSPEPTPHPCGQCEVCQTIARGSALDVIEIDAASNTGVDNIRELIERAQFAPVQCRYKVYIIDEVHMLSTAAFNALLKTLEEPPDRIVFVLATTDPQRVLPTIISRCQRFDYRRIPLDAMVQHLRQIADKEAIPTTDEAITLVAQIAQGGLRDAESLLDQLSLLTGKIGVEQVWDLVGSVPERDLLELLQAIAQDNPETVLDSTRRLMDRGREPLIVLQNLGGFYRDLLIAKTAPNRNDLVAITAPTWQQLCELAQTLSLATILTGQQHLRAAEVQLKNTTQPRLWLEVTLMGLLPSAIASHAAIATGEHRTPEFAPSSQPKTTLPTSNGSHPSATQPSTPARSTNGQAAQSTQPVAAPTPTPPEPPPATPPTAPVAPPAAAPPEPPTPATLEVEQVWQSVIQAIRPYSTQVMVKQQCQLLQFDGHTARLAVSSQPLFKMAQGKLPNIEAAFQTVFTRKIQVVLEVKAAPAIAAPTNPAPEAHSPPQPTVEQPSPATPEPPFSPTQPTPPSPPPITEQAVPPPVGPPPQFDAIAPTAQSDLSPSVLSWEPEEGAAAARSLADFFAGTVVDLDHPAASLGPGLQSGLPTAEQVAKDAQQQTNIDIVEDDDDEDVPF